MPPYNFPASLVATRSEMIRSFLRQQQLQGWIAWRPDELLMMTGYLPYWGTSVLLWLAQGPPILFVPVLEPRDHLPSEVTVKQYPWGSLDCADPYKVLADAIRSELNNAGVDPARVGMLRGSARSALPIMAAEQIPLPEMFWETFTTVASGGTAESEKAFLQLYVRKTPGDIEKIRLANHVSGVGIATFYEMLTPGTREIDISAAVESAVQRQTGEGNVFYSRAWAMVQSGPNSADAGHFNRSTARRLQKGDLVLLEQATCVNGYWSDLTRTATVGDPKPELARVLALVTEAQETAIHAIRPGASGAEVDAAARGVISRENMAGYFTHFTGHHVGFRYHDPGFALCPGVFDKLEPGMIVTIEPGVYVPELGGGARMEDDVLVTDTGFEVLSR